MPIFQAWLRPDTLLLSLLRGCRDVHARVHPRRRDFRDRDGKKDSQRGCVFPGEKWDRILSSCRNISPLRPRVCIANRSRSARDGRDRVMRRGFVKLSRRDVPKIPKIKSSRYSLDSFVSTSKPFSHSLHPYIQPVVKSVNRKCDRIS